MGVPEGPALIQFKTDAEEAASLRRAAEIDRLIREECEHGKRNRVIGRGKSGRFWAALMCPVRDEDCPPEWVRDTEVYAAWRDAVSAGETSNDTGDDPPPF